MVSVYLLKVNAMGLIVCMLAQAAAGAALATGQAPALTDGIDVQIPPQIAPHVPQNLRGYFVVFLVNPPVARDFPHELFLRHQAYIRRLVEAGVFKLVGPLTDGGRIRGMKIVSAASAEQARTIAEADPAVQAQVFAVEVHPATLPSLATLKIQYADTR